MERQYWATLPVDQAAKEIYRRIDSYFQWLRLTGTYKLWLKCLREYYAGFSTGGELAEDGDQGEMLRSKENHFHNIGQNIIVVAGNARELRNTLERAAILCDGGLIQAEHLSLSGP